MVPSNLTGMILRQTEQAVRKRVLSDKGLGSVSDWSTASDTHELLWQVTALVDANKGIGAAGSVDGFSVAIVTGLAYADLLVVSWSMIVFVSEEAFVYEDMKWLSMWLQLLHMRRQWILLGMAVLVVLTGKMNAVDYASCYSGHERQDNKLYMYKDFPSLHTSSAYI